MNAGNIGFVSTITLTIIICIFFINLLFLKVLYDMYVRIFQVDSKVSMLMMGFKEFVTSATKLVSSVTDSGQSRMPLKEYVDQLKDEAAGLSPEDIEQIKKLLQEEDDEDED